MVKKALAFVTLLLLLLRFCTVLSEGDQASDSSQFHGDERHSGFIASAGPTSAHLAWKIIQKCISMVAPNGRLLVADNKYTYILNETSGAKVAYTDYGFGSELRTCYPVVGGGNIFVSFKNDYGLIHTIARDLSLNRKWVEYVTSVEKARIIYPPYTVVQLAYSKGKLFEAFSYTSGDISGVLRARLASTGNILWETSFNVSHTISTIPTVGEGVVAIGFLDNSMITALSTDSGEILWSFATDSPIISTPAYSSGYFYFGSTKGTVYAVSKEGKELWHVNLGSTIETTPAVAFGKVFVGADDGNLYALKATTGELLWKYPTKGPIIASPIVSLNEIVYVGSTDGYIYALSVETGDLIWSDNTGASIVMTPVLDNGMLFVASSDGTISAYYTVNVSTTSFTAVKSNTTIVTQTITNTQTVAITTAIPSTTTLTTFNTTTSLATLTTTVFLTKFIPATITTTETIKEVSYISTVSYITTATVVMEKPLFGEEGVALGVSIAMVVTSIIIGLWFKRKRVS